MSPQSQDPSQKDRQEIQALAMGLMCGAIAAAELDEGVDQKDLDDLLAEPASEAHWAKIEEAFQGFRVPFDPHLRAIYEITLGVNDPQSWIAALPLPFLSARVTTPWSDWDCCDLESVMDTEHLWPLERMLEGDEDAFPMVIVAHGASTGLAISETGKWAALSFDGEGGREPRREDFTLTLLEALRLYVDAKLVEWAAGIADEEIGGYHYQGMDLSTEDLPGPVQVVFDKLAAPRDLNLYKRAGVEVFAPHWNAAAAPGAMPSDADHEAPEVHVPAPEDRDLLAIVGLPFADYAKVQHEIAVGSPIALKLVDDNPHDANAVEAWFTSGAEESFRIGFISRGDALEVRSRLASGTWGAEAVVATAHAGFLEIEMQSACG